MALSRRLPGAIERGQYGLRGPHVPLQPALCISCVAVDPVDGDVRRRLPDFRHLRHVRVDGRVDPQRRSHAAAFAARLCAADLGRRAHQRDRDRVAGRPRVVRDARVAGRVRAAEHQYERAGHARRRGRGRGRQRAALPGDDGRRAVPRARRAIALQGRRRQAAPVRRRRHHAVLRLWRNRLRSAVRRHGVRRLHRRVGLYVDRARPGRDFGAFGALSADVTHARAKLWWNGATRNGNSYRINYSKHFDGPMPTCASSVIVSPNANTRTSRSSRRPDRVRPREQQAALLGDAVEAFRRHLDLFLVRPDDLLGTRERAARWPHADAGVLDRHAAQPERERVGVPHAERRCKRQPGLGHRDVADRRPSHRHVEPDDGQRQHERERGLHL